MHDGIMQAGKQASHDGQPGLNSIRSTIMKMIHFFKFFFFLLLLLRKMPSANIEIRVERTTTVFRWIQPSIRSACRRSTFSKIDFVSSSRN